MKDVLPERQCEICGGPIRDDNIVGICRRNPECERIRAERQRRAQGVRPRGTTAKPCKVEGCSKPRRSGGYCGMHYARVQRHGDPGPAESWYQTPVIHIGDRFGRWTALENFARDNLRVLCRCDCGTERRVSAASLVHGGSKSCGCLTGVGGHSRFGKEPYLEAGTVATRLTVLETAMFSTDFVAVRCECGTEKRVRASSVKGGTARSCGCLKLEQIWKHGLSDHPLYGIWYGIYRRTSVPTDKDYPDYGGRGISLYEGWHGMPDGFLRFVEYLAQHVGERPPGTTLDRWPDNNGSYEPGNLRWATGSQQNGNRRKVDEMAREIAQLRAQIAALTVSDLP